MAVMVRPLTRYVVGCCGTKSSVFLFRDEHEGLGGGGRHNRPPASPPWGRQGCSSSVPGRAMRALCHPPRMVHVLRDVF